MAKSAPVIALELNELCPPLLDRWMADGSLPHFKRLHDASEVFTTDADAAEPGTLEPWVQWYSIHTGLPYAEHGVFHLTDGARASHPDVWRMVIAAGGRAMSFGSMNARPFAAPGSVFVGDPWTEKGDASPAELNTYNRFVAHHVREYSNADQAMGAGAYAAFLRFVLTHGLSTATAWRIVRQLAAERAAGHLSYRRAAILDTLQFDVFRHYWRATRPRFASFFANSVAHLQHGYWRHMEPDAFALKPDEAERARYAGAIRDGYVAMDALVGRFLRLAERVGAVLVLQTALSQQPFVKYDGVGGQRFFRLRDAGKFLERVGVHARTVDPTMTNQCMLTFADDHARDAARARLAAFAYADGRAVFDFAAHDAAAALCFGPQVPAAGGVDAVVTDRATGRRFPASEALYELDGAKSGRHSPSGALWIAGRPHRRREETASVLDILPTTLDLMGMDGAPGPGRSLLRDP